MHNSNYDEAKNHVLSQKIFIDFINRSAERITQKCRDGIPYLDIERAYVKELEIMDLSRLESFILIAALRDILEDGENDAPPCIDSFIDGIFTTHTGNCAFSELLRFKNEPAAPLELGRYIDSEVWMEDSSWKERGKYFS